jgi:hypothetical protein
MRPASIEELAGRYEASIRELAAAEEALRLAQAERLRLGGEFARRLYQDRAARPFELAGCRYWANVDRKGVNRRRIDRPVPSPVPSSEESS